MAHFHKNFDVTVTINGTGYSVRIHNSEVDLRKKKVIATPEPRLARSKHGREVDLRKKKSLPFQFPERSLQFTRAGLNECPFGPALLNIIQHSNPFSKYTEVRGPLEHYNNKLWPTRLTCCGPPVEKQCTSLISRLITVALKYVITPCSSCKIFHLVDQQICPRGL